MTGSILFNQHELTRNCRLHPARYSILGWWSQSALPVGAWELRPPGRAEQQRSDRERTANGLRTEINSIYVNWQLFINNERNYTSHSGGWFEEIVSGFSFVFFFFVSLLFLCKFSVILCCVETWLIVSHSCLIYESCLHCSHTHINYVCGQTDRWTVGRKDICQFATDFLRSSNN